MPNGHADKRPRRPIGLGVLGVGDIAQHLYLPKIKDAEPQGRIRLAAASSRSEAGRSWLADRHPEVAIFSSLDDMLAHPEVDVVVNLTPGPVHGPTTLQAIRAGKHVFSEKPIAATLEEADAIVEAAREHNVTVGCAPVIALHPEVWQAITWVRQGVLGKVSMVRARASHPGPAWDPAFASDPTWFYQPGAGPVLDLAVYPLSVLTVMLGRVERVTALSGISYPERIVRSGPAKGATVTVETPDNVQMVLDFGNACFATIDATWNVLSAKGPRMEIYGDRGVLNLYSRPDEPAYELFTSDPVTGLSGWLQQEPPYHGSLMPTTTPLAAAEEWTFVDGLMEFTDCVAAGTTPILDAERARHVLDVCLAALSSGELGRVVSTSTTPPTLDERAL